MKMASITHANELRPLGERGKVCNIIAKTCYLKGKKLENKGKKNKNTRQDLNRKSAKPPIQKTQTAQLQKIIFQGSTNQRPTFPTRSPINVKNKSLKGKLTESFENSANDRFLKLVKTPKKIKQKNKTPHKQREARSQPFILQQKQEIKQQNCPNFMLKLRKNSSFRKLDSRKNLSAQHNKGQSQSPKLRYAKFQFRTQKYSKIAEELKTSGKLVASSEKQISQKIARPQSGFKSKVASLQKRIIDYRSLSSKSQTALKKIQSVKRREQKQFQKKVKQYQQQIKKLEAQLQEYRPNIGHLYSYKEYTNQKLVPDDIIMEECQQSKFKGLQYQLEVKAKGLTLMQHYYNQDLESSVSSQNSEICLSIISNSNQH